MTPSNYQLCIREADPIADRERIRSVLARNLPSAAPADRYEWLYLSNPCGRSLVWLAEEVDTGKPVGTSAAHRRRVRVNGRVVTALILGDSAIDPAYRFLGPALQLHRATLAPVNEGRYAFSCDHPGPTMLAVYRRLGYAELGKMQRWVRLLQAIPVLKRRYGDRIGTKILGAMSDFAIRIKDTAARLPRGLSVTFHQGQYGAEFDALAERLAGLRPIMGVRSANYLSWRYGRNPIWRHDTLCAWRGEQLVGYLIVRTVEPETLSVVELLAVDDPEVWTGLAVELVALARSRGAVALTAEVLRGCVAATMFRKMGFLLREDGIGPVVYAQQGSELAQVIYSIDNWWMVGGDRDA
ncbi:MAG: GNAT family N-acetyltransferase [Candidatus Entotheonellia bacterium]